MIRMALLLGSMWYHFKYWELGLIVVVLHKNVW
jgi:hypothetical protein